MGERKVERTIPYIFEPNGDKGAREDDEFLLDIFQEKKKTFRLKRFRYLIRIGKSFCFEATSGDLTLPVFTSDVGTGLKTDKQEFELVLVKHPLSRGYDQRSRYLFRSLGDIPFRLNGIYSYEAFIERGDTLEIGFNRISFLRPKPQLKLVGENESLSSEMMKSSLNVMIEGETGTGKTTLARTIHEESGRSGAFVHLNLSSFSSGLIESELFGHVKGAFTGALSEKKGAILEAHKGTLFLDEIDSLSMELQTKLLLFLDNHEVRPVGGNRSVKSNVRLVFASGTPLKTLVEEGRMRRDFFYRLTSGIVVSLESLRQNPARIRECCLQFEREHFTVLSSDLLAFYETCPWPGNLRQLLAHLHKKRILSAGKKLVLEQLDYELKEDSIPQSSFQSQSWKSLEQMKTDYCENVFHKCGKNVSRASKVLDISPNTLKAILNKSRNHQVVDVNL